MLDRVTLTGADDSVEPAKLIELWREFPFVEFGILYSQRHTGSPRFPSGDWMVRLAGVLPDEAPDLPLSLHLCGSVVRGLLLGKLPSELPIQWRHDESGLLRPAFQRLQLNFHGEPAPIDAKAFEAALNELGKRQIIFQFDGVSGEKYFDALFEIEPEPKLDCVPLFDLSGGAGEVPKEWPKPEYCTTDADYTYHGYAGGLGPDNVLAELKRINAAIRVPGMNEPDVWIDMVSKVRSDRDQRFDLAKCRRVLELVKPLIGKSQRELAEGL